MISIDGNTSAYLREPCNLRHDSVPIVVESEYNPLHTHIWVKWEHYVPVKHDMSDLIEKIRWCQDNDEMAKEIAFAGRALFEKLYSYEAMQEDTASVFSKYADMMKYEPKINDARPFESFTWNSYEGLTLEEHLIDPNQEEENDEEEDFEIDDL